jgi:hypothetical protein
MILFDLLIAVSVGVFLTVVFSFIFKRTGPWDNTFLFFIITFLGTWAIGLWLKPIGPSFYGYYWIGYLAAGIFLAMIIASAGPPNTFKRKDLENVKLKEDLIGEKRNQSIIQKDFFLLGLILIFFLAILMGYLMN